MCKVVLILFLLSTGFTGRAQKNYVCEFADTMIAILDDSVLLRMSQFSPQDDVEVTKEMRDQLFSEMRASFPTMYQLRIVNATKDQTVISMDRNSRSGSLTMETFDSILYKNDEIFLKSGKGFSTNPLNSPKKEFISTGKKITILNYKCDEYLSTDSTCYIWVTTELPDYINPGIRKGNIKGAVLGFQLKANVTITKCILTRFGRGL